MMPTHGYGIFRSLLLGSVTAKVLHDAACPVWTGVHVEETPPASAAFENIMCAVDLTEKSVPTMQLHPSSLRTSRPSCGWCMPCPAPRRGRKNISMPTCRPSCRTKPEKSLRKMQADAGVVGQLCLGAGEVPHVVREAALHHNADLLVIGTRSCDPHAGTAADECIFDHPAIALPGDQRLDDWHSHANMVGVR